MILWKAVIIIVLIVGVFFNILSGRVPRERWLVHIAYLPLAWVGLFNVVTTNPLLGFPVVVVCCSVILSDYLRKRRAKGG